MPSTINKIFTMLCPHTPKPRSYIYPCTHYTTVFFIDPTRSKGEDYFCGGRNTLS